MATTIIISLLIGLTAGIFGGILGTGGGLIMIPLMVEVLKLTRHKSEWPRSLQTSADAITYSLNSAIDITAATLLVLTSVFTASLGARSTHYFRAATS